MVSELNVVTGAFGFTGRYITHQLLALGKKVRTLTGHPERPNPFGNRVEVAPLDFDSPGQLVTALRGAAILYNTYWVRFCYGSVTFEKAIANTETLIRAAEQAGVARTVHLSVTHASQQSPLPYYKGKAAVEKAIVDSRLSYAILRPSLIFGVGDILINNIAWLLRRFPVFAIPGRGEYRLQPVFVEDVAQLAVGAAHQLGNTIFDAAGPEVYTFKELVRLIAKTVRSRARILSAQPKVALFLARLLGYAVGDVLLTPEEVDGLMANLLISAGPPTGRTHFSAWLAANAHRVGIRYNSELAQHYR